MAFQTYTQTTYGPITYYEEYTTTNLYVERTFGGHVKQIAVTNDSVDDPVQVSFDAATLEAEVKPGETFDISCPSRTNVHIKATTGGDNVRIIAK